MSRDDYLSHVAARREFRSELRSIIYSRLSPEEMEERIDDLLELDPYGSDSVNHQFAAAMLLQGHLLPAAEERGDMDLGTQDAILRQVRILNEYRSPAVVTIARSLEVLGSSVPEHELRRVAAQTAEMLDSRGIEYGCIDCDGVPPESPATIREEARTEAVKHINAIRYIRSLARSPEASGGE